MVRHPVPSLTYRAVGVDRAGKDAVLAALGPRIRSTYRGGTLGTGGGFGGLFHLTGYRDPVLVTSIDGVGTKVRVADIASRWRVVGADIVSHGANDVLCQGATPLFMLDYIASGALVRKVVAEIIEGIVQACLEQGVILIGGETAEMPGVYAREGHDIVGCTVGVVERNQMITGAAIRPDDVIVGIGGDGLHTNGYSLVRAALLPPGRAAARRALDRRPKELSGSLGDELLRPHRPYAHPVLALRERVPIRGIAHVTGGGIPANLARILPEGCRARVSRGRWPVSPLFAMIQRRGNVADEEMFRTFNMGLGLLLVIRERHADTAVAHLERSGERAWVVGRIVAGSRGIEIRA